jgi:hypothetical protein
MGCLCRMWIMGRSSSRERPHALVAPRVQPIFCRRRHQARRPTLAKIRPGSPAPAMGPGTAAGLLPTPGLNTRLKAPAFGNDGSIVMIGSMKPDPKSEGLLSTKVFATTCTFKAREYCVFEVSVSGAAMENNVWRGRPGPVQATGAID